MSQLGELLSLYNLAEVARRIGKTREYVWRLRHGGRLTDMSVIPKLARVLRIPEMELRAIVTGAAPVSDGQPLEQTEAS